MVENKVRHNQLPVCGSRYTVAEACETSALTGRRNCGTARVKFCGTLGARGRATRIRISDQPPPSGPGDDSLVRSMRRKRR